MFYNVPVNNLIFILLHGLFPIQRIEVSVCYAPISRRYHRWREGTKKSDDRRTP